MPSGSAWDDLLVVEGVETLMFRQRFVPRYFY